MKRIILIILAVLPLGDLAAQGIEFQKGTWSIVQAKAKQQNKFIFVDAYTTWCAPCKKLEKKVFTQKKVGDFFNRHFVSYRLDMEKGEGKAFAKKYKVYVFPSLLYFDTNGNIVHKTIGYVSAQQILAYAQDALNPNKQIYTLRRQYQKGGLTASPDYVAALELAGEPYQKALVEYLEKQGQQQWHTLNNWKLINKYIRNYTSEVFQYVLDHQSQFDQISKGEMQAFFAKVLEQEMRKVVAKKDEKKLQKLKQVLTKVFGKEANPQIAKLEAGFYFTNPQKSLKYASHYFDKYCNNPNELSIAAWAYYENISNQTFLLKALEWAKKSVSIQKKSYNTNTQAHLLYKLKRYEKARLVALESKKLAIKENESTDEIEKLLKKLRMLKK